jgi:hypothetical protein
MGEVGDQDIERLSAKRFQTGCQGVRLDHFCRDAQPLRPIRSGRGTNKQNARSFGHGEDPQQGVGELEL